MVQRNRKKLEKNWCPSSEKRLAVMILFQCLKVVAAGSEMRAYDQLFQQTSSFQEIH